MSILKAAATSKVARVGVALGLTAGALVATAGSSSAATLAATLSPATGPSVSTTTVLTVTGSGFKNAAGVVQIGVIDFNAATTCPASAAGTAATAKSIVSATKAVVTTPSLAHTTVAGVHSKKDYQLCMYKAVGGALYAAAKYTVYPAPTVTGLDVTSGSVLGGNTIAVTGTGFTTKTTATIGGTALTNIKVAATGDSFTATVPAHAAGAADVRVTTEGGTSANVVADNYTFLNGVVVSPQFGVNTTATTITVRGVGFSSMDFTNSGAARVFFVRGAYDPTDNSGSKTNAEVAECAPASVQVVSDTELVCDTPNTLSNNAYTVTVVNDEAVDAQAGGTYLQSVVSSSSTFTFAAF